MESSPAERLCANHVEFSRCFVDLKRTSGRKLNRFLLCRNTALFTIAHNQPFVFIHRCYKESASLGQTQKLLGILQGFVKQTRESRKFPSISDDSMCSLFLHLASAPNLLHRANSQQQQQQDDTQAFKRFLFRHIEQALTDGWANDGISGGTRSESSLFELCTYPVWTRLFSSLRELFDTPSSTNKIMRQAHGMVRANIDPDGKLSETRCKKCLPMAIKYYEDGLPSRYTRHFHEQRVRRNTSIQMSFRLTKSLVSAASNDGIFRHLCPRFQL